MTHPVILAMMVGWTLLVVSAAVVVFGPERIRPFFATTATVSLASIILLFLASVMNLI